MCKWIFYSFLFIVHYDNQWHDLKDLFQTQETYYTLYIQN